MYIHPSLFGCYSLPNITRAHSHSGTAHWLESRSIVLYHSSQSCNSDIGSNLWALYIKFSDGHLIGRLEPWVFVTDEFWILLYTRVIQYIFFFSFLKEIFFLFCVALTGQMTPTHVLETERVTNIPSFTFWRGLWAITSNVTQGSLHRASLSNIRGVPPGKGIWFTKLGCTEFVRQYMAYLQYGNFI